MKTGETKAEGRTVKATNDSEDRHRATGNKERRLERRAETRRKTSTGEKGAETPRG